MRSNVKVKIIFLKIQYKNVSDLNNKNFNLLSNSHAETEIQRLMSFLIVCFVPRDKIFPISFSFQPEGRLAQNPGQSLSSGIILSLNSVNRIG